jgi:hypothetical protein
MPNLDSDHNDDTPLRFHRLDDVLGPSAVPGLVEHKLAEELHTVSVEEPVSLEEVARDTSLHAAMVEELRSIEENGTCVPVDPPSNQWPIGLKWVYKAKRDEYGHVIKHKAWLIVKGYVHRQGINFEEVLALVAHIELVRLILAVAAHEGWHVHHMDVKSTFLNGELEEDVYVRQLSGFVAGQEHQMLKLKKALYGLRQAPRAWYCKLHTSLHSLRFVCSNHEHAVYTRRTASRSLVISVYVDDLLIGGSVDEDIAKFKQEMQEQFGWTIWDCSPTT